MTTNKICNFFKSWSLASVSIISEQPWYMWLISYGVDGEVRYSPHNIYNGILFPSLNHAKIFDSIPNEHSHKVVRQLAKSQAQWFTSSNV